MFSATHRRGAQHEAERPRKGAGEHGLPLVAGPIQELLTAHGGGVGQGGDRDREGPEQEEDGEDDGGPPEDEEAALLLVGRVC